MSYKNIKRAFMAGYEAGKNKIAESGWDEQELDRDGLMYVLDEISSLDYELRSCRRGAYTGCKTYDELAYWIEEKARDLQAAASALHDIEEDFDEEY